MDNHTVHITESRTSSLSWALLVKRHYNKEVPWGEPASVVTRGEVVGFRCLVSGFGLVLCSKVQILKPDPGTCLPLESDPASRVVTIEVSALNIYNVFYNTKFGRKGRDLNTFWNMFQVCKFVIGLEYKGKNIGFRFIIGYSSLRDFGP